MQQVASPQQSRYVEKAAAANPENLEPASTTNTNTTTNTTTTTSLLIGEGNNELGGNLEDEEENWKRPLLFFDQNFRRCSISSESHAINPSNSLLNIGNYQVNRESDCLGKNWYYKIYKGYHIQTGNFVVIKHVYNQDVILKLRERIETFKEKQLGTEFNPYVAHTFASVTLPVMDDSGNILEGEEFYVVVEEFLENGSLSMLSQKGYKPSEKVIAMYIDQVLQGIMFLHQKLKMAHLNVTPNNTMLSRNGQIKLSDIGFLLSREEYIKYQPCINYSSPSLFHNRDGTCEWTKQALADTWSVGCIVIELMTDKRPFYDYDWTSLFELLSNGNNVEEMIRKYYPKAKYCSELVIDFLNMCFKNHSYNRSYIKNLTHHPWILKHVGNVESSPTHPTPHNEVKPKYILMVQCGSRKKKLTQKSQFSSIHSLEDFIKTKCETMLEGNQRISFIEIMDRDCDDYIELDDLDLLYESPHINQIRIYTSSPPATPSPNTSTKLSSSSFNLSYTSTSLSIPSPQEPKSQLWNDRYLPLRKIQSGGFSSVYLCEDNFGSPSQKNLVALKLLPVDMENNGSGHSFNEAMREALQMLMFNHPNIVKVLDVFQHYYNPISFESDTNGDCAVLCIVMSYYPYGDLSSLVRDSDPLPLKIIISIMQQILSALIELHSRKVIHRDIKPQNVLIESIEKNERNQISKVHVLVGDFGLSKHIVESRAFSVSGTMGFQSPELQLNQGYSFKADVWSSGVVLYQLLTRNERKNIFLEMIQKGEEKTLALILCEIEGIYSSELLKPSMLQLLALLKATLKFLPEERVSSSEALQIINSHVD